MKLNFILPEESILPLASAHAHTHTHTHTHTHKRGVNPTGQPPRGTSWVMLTSVVLQLSYNSKST